MSRKQQILDVVGDLAGSLLYYDRKEDEDLGIGEIQEALSSGEINIDEIKRKFSDSLDSGLGAKIR